jgi:hypothetical protein
MTTPFKQFDAQFSFEVANLSTKRWLRHMQLFRSPRETELVGNSYKITRVAKFHARLTVFPIPFTADATLGTCRSDFGPASMINRKRSDQSVHLLSGGLLDAKR